MFTFTVFTVLLLVITAYIYKKKKALKQAENAKEHSGLGFVVETFHELVNKLKEEEKKLEQLRAFAEEKALSLEVYNENVLQSVPSGVISINNELKIKSMNQAAERILGISAKEVIDKNFMEVFNEPLITIMRGDKPVSRAEYPYVTGDGRHIWIGVTTSELKNTGGEKMGMIFVFTDLTDIKALQAQVELKKRLSQLGEMSAGISHELRNSMSVISGYAKLLGKKVDASNKATVDAIQAEIGNMDKIISELLSFAKPAAPLKEKTDLNVLLSETLAAVIGDSDTIHVSTNYEKPVSINADVVLLRQALSNLIINAVEATPDGGSIDIGLSCIRNRAEINIRDTGCGISRDAQQKIFLPFYTTKQEGTGLGLALVQKIIVAHGGSIEVESEAGKGTAFRITLPMTG